MIEYCVPETDSEYWFELKKTDTSWPTLLASVCAKDFFSEHGGDECSWPLEFIIKVGGKNIGRYVVSMDFEPQFYAKELKEEK